jgi:hypothetical protein
MCAFEEISCDCVDDISLAQSVYTPVASFCEHVNERSSSINDKEFLGRLSYYQCLKKSWPALIPLHILDVSNAATCWCFAVRPVPADDTFPGMIVTSWQCSMNS